MKLLHAGPQITSGDITTFESEIGGQFPDDYRQFLLEFNGGVPTPPVGISWNEWIEGVTFYSLEKTSDSGLRRAFKELDETDTDGFLPIGGTSNDREICMDCWNKIGAIYLTEYTIEQMHTRNRDIPVAVTTMWLADSFDEFLGKLVEIPDPYCRIEALGKEGTAADVSAYLAEGHSIDAVGKNHLTLICEAIKFDNMPIFNACMQHGACLSNTIYIAVQNQRADLLEALVSAGANVNERDGFGKTPLSYVGGTKLPGERGESNRKLERQLLRLGAIK